MAQSDDVMAGNSSNDNTLFAILGSVVGAWFLGMLPVAAFVLLNLALSFLFDVRYLPRELMGSIGEIAILVIVIPLVVGGALLGAWFWFTRNDTIETAVGAQAPEFDDFASACFETGLTEEHDPRQARDFDELTDIDSAVDRNDMETALALAEAAMAEHPDSFLFPCRIADIRTRIGDDDGAAQVLIAALRACKSKANIAEQMGQLAWKKGRVLGALTFWIQSAHMQLSSGRPVHYVPFLKLSYVASGLSLEDEREYLKYKSDKISSLGPIDLDENAADELKRVASLMAEADRDSVTAALKLLVGDRRAPYEPPPVDISFERAPSRPSAVEYCPLCGSPMVQEPNHVHCENGHSKIVVNPLGGSYLARSAEVAEALKAKGYRVQGGDGERPLFTIYPP